MLHVGWLTPPPAMFTKELRSMAAPSACRNALLVPGPLVVFMRSMKLPGAEVAAIVMPCFFSVGTSRNGGDRAPPDLVAGVPGVRIEIGDRRRLAHSEDIFG